MEEMRVDDGGLRERKVPVNYPPNSRKSKEERKPVEKIITGNVQRRKKPLTERIKANFTEEDGQSAGQFVLFEVLIPAAKKMLSDAVSQGIDRVLFGESRPRHSERPGYTNYSKMHHGSRSEGYRDISRRSRSSRDLDDVVLSSRTEAQDVLDRLGDLIDQFEVATVADLYDLLGVSGSFTDNKWGWYDLRDARIRAIRDGYLIVLPRTEPID
jgi:hypothetical protein